MFSGLDRYRLVLDTSAVLAYGNGSIHVGEILAECADEEDVTVAVPLLAMIEAYMAGADMSMLQALDVLPPISVIPFQDEDDVALWPRYAIAASLYGSPVRAYAALMVVARRAAFVLTCEPEHYGDLPTIGI